MEDLLGTFDLPPATTPIKPPPTTKAMPTTKANSTKKSVDTREIFQEVEMALYDSDSLPSPPSSTSSSEADPKDQDKLLDFSRDDEFNYDPGAPLGLHDPALDDLEAPHMMKAMLQARHGIEVGERYFLKISQ